ncbi:hypothetical protein [Sphingobium sp. IP1]|uniref:hypothetical protein n=1 Tax=Sphingobium sp. IP1 TaxID=2021637 RepID=UPI00117BA90E|nr:hypothetical protein [Sphingobium sp. IP1]
MTAYAPTHLPKWETLTEAMKMFIAFDAGMEFQSCYAFTAHVNEALIGKWSAATHGFMANVEQRLKRALHRQGLQAIPYCYLVETRSRSGRSSTRPHLHGFFIAETPIDAARFQVALERAFHPDLIRKTRQRAIKVEPAYDNGGNFAGRSQWLSYMIKNIDRWDARLGKRRVHLSRSLIGIAREAWELRREP